MKTITANDVMSTAYGVDAWLPVLTKDIGLLEWVSPMLGQSVTTRNGYEMSLFRDTMFKSQMAMTNIALALRAANELGVLPYTQAVKHMRDAHRLIEQVSMGFAAHRGENHRELVLAEVTLAVKDGCFDETTSGAPELYSEEELLECGYDYEQIEEILEMQEAALTSHNSGERAGSMSEDEGKLITAIHDPSQLWDMEFTDIDWIEAATAKVALIGKQWPQPSVAWDLVLDRLADSWAAALEYADDKEAMQKKIERRMTSLDDLHAKPMYARWAINHVTRRVWRDIQALKMTKERFEQQLERLDRQAFAEERYNAPARVTRVGMGEATELSRVQYLPFGDISEADVGFGPELVRMTVFGSETANAVIDSMPHLGADGVHFHTGGGHQLDTGTQEDRDRAWFNAVIEACEAQRDAITPVYKELRELDLSLSKLWELFARDAMPVAPPVYWNKHGWYLTEQEAQDALPIEQAEWKAKTRMMDDDAALAAIQLMLASK